MEHQAVRRISGLDLAIAIAGAAVAIGVTVSVERYLAAAMIAVVATSGTIWQVSQARKDTKRVG